ncbi:hypothetical protein [Haloparvum sp. AD34]
MATTTTVKRALAALAARTDVDRGPHVAVIDEAEAALGDLDRAAGFVDSVGLDRLETAIETAETAGDAAAAERGTDALDAYRAFRRAAAGQLDPESVDAEATPETDRRAAE